MPGLLGKKIGMTSVFSAEGQNVPCTVIEVGPCVVTQIKTVEKDGYAAVQLGFQEAKEKNTSAPLMGHFKKAGVTPKRHLAEFKGFDQELNLGDTLTVELFNDTQYVDVVGTSKGKGFQGVVKRHGFGGVGQSARFNRCLFLPRQGIQGNAHGWPNGWRPCNYAKLESIKGSPRTQPSHYQGFCSRLQRFNRNYREVSNGS